MSDDHEAAVAEARQWLQTHMPGDVTAAREARNRMILALNREGFTQRVIADAVECSKDTVNRVLSDFRTKQGEDIRRDPRGGSRTRHETPVRAPETAVHAGSEAPSVETPGNVVNASERFQKPTPEYAPSPEVVAARGTADRMLETDPKSSVFAVLERTEREVYRALDLLGDAITEHDYGDEYINHSLSLIEGIIQQVKSKNNERIHRNDRTG